VGSRGLRRREVVVSLAAIILLTSLFPGVRADTVVFIAEGYDEAIVPVMFGNSTDYRHGDSMGLSVTDDGIMFMVSYCFMWQLVRGETPVSLIAWSSDGTIMWSYTWGNWRRQLFDVTNDGSHVYVTGRIGGNIFVEKYDFVGQLVWNKTVDLGKSEVGFEIGVLEDGTIIIGGYQYSEPEPDQVLSEGILVALDQGGDYSWHATFDEHPYPLCDTNYVYITSLNTFQKLDSSGEIIWFVESKDSHLSCVREDVFYTYRGYTTNYTFTRHNGSTFEGPRAHTEVDILSWNTETGLPLNMNNIKFCDYNNQMFNRTELQSTVAEDGSLKMLIGAYDLDKWYLSSINPTTELTSCKLLLNGTWQHVQLDIDVSDNIYLAATSSTHGLTVMKFDSSQLASALSFDTNVISPPLILSNGGMNDVQLIAMTLIGVTVFDVVLILYLKKRMAN
jgi:hypothetical protein